MKIVIPIDVNDSVLVDSNVPETDAQLYRPDVTYGNGEKVLANHRVYVSAVAGNVGNPVTDSTKWTYAGASNRWRLHDQKLQVQTENQVSIVNKYRLNSPVNCLAFLNLSAASVQVTMTDLDGTAIYDSGIINLVSDSGIQDLYAYFFTPVVRKKDLFISDIPLYANCFLTVTINEPISAAAKCGEIVIGTYWEVGPVQYGAKFGYSDFSLKTADGFGNSTFIERDYKRTADYQVQVKAGYVDQIYELMTSRRAKPTLFVGSENYGISLIYGVPRDFYVVVAYPTYSLCNFSLEGLT